MDNERQGYGKEYADTGVWDKLVKYARIAGKEVIEKALRLYYAAEDPNTPTWAKTVIYGALGYLIFPLDALPDVTPMVGYTDDFGVLAAAIATIALYITDEVKRKAAQTMRDWFSDEK